MSALAADRALDSPDNLKVPLSFSIAMHAALAALLIYSGLHTQTGDLWGGPGGGAVTVGLVGTVPGTGARSERPAASRYHSAAEVQTRKA
jgi:membrane protein involved in colicin uptake